VKAAIGGRPVKSRIFRNSRGLSLSLMKVGIRRLFGTSLLRDCVHKALTFVFVSILHNGIIGFSLFEPALVH